MGYGVGHVDVLPLGVDAATFHPGRRDPALRAEFGLPEGGPLLAYAGRLDNEKRADRLIAMFRELPPALGASMILIGEGKLRGSLAEAARGLPVVLPGYCADRAGLARLLASSDIYVAAMARAVAAIWHGGPLAIGQRARAHVIERFSWDHTFELLFGEVYPRALAASWRRQQKSGWFRRPPTQPLMTSQRAG